jgi:VWFA-related protein
MSILDFSIKLLLLVLLFCNSTVFTLAQDEKKNTLPNEATEKKEEDVLKISTALIQTGAAIFDKKGQFVDNLKPEDFELLVDGKSVPISFFEQNTLKNSENSKKEIDADNSKTKISNNIPVKPIGRGRNIIFLVDDVHLSADGHNRTRKLILKFIDEEMIPEDTVAVVSSSGKIGFLQQFTNDKIVLRAAIERLIYSRDYSANDRFIPPMTEYEALLISQFDPQVTDIFASQEPGGELDSKREAVRSRARAILTQVAITNRATYSTLEQAVRNSAQLPGRKIVFFISDGFLLDPTNSDSSYRLKRITDAAARTNAVIYSFDSKGLEAGFPEGTTASDPRFGYRVQSGERFEVQDGLSSLADSTGGKFIRNTNDLKTGLTNSLNEASQYYLLAWEPVLEDSKAERLRKIEVRVKSRPELKVRFQNGYLDESLTADSNEKNKTKNKKDKKDKKGKNPDVSVSIPEQQLNTALTSPLPARALPTSLTVNYLDVPNEGMLLAVASQIKSDAVEFISGAERAKANVDVLGAVYDANGKRQGFFRELLTVDAALFALSKTERQDIYHNYQIKLKPGLYQVRVAARDVKSGRTGSAVQWIEIPDLSSRRLALSSLILSEKKDEIKTKPENNTSNIEAMKLPVTVDRRFASNSQLRYIIFIYNAAPRKTETKQPDVTLQTQILRGSQVILSSPVRQISTVGQDSMRLAYAAEISLKELPVGVYELLVVVQDRNAKSNNAQRISFEVK